MESIILLPEGEWRGPGDTRGGNVCFVSPWSGLVWARILTVREQVFHPLIRPARGERPYLPWPPGSLCNFFEYRDGGSGFETLPRSLLVRELDLGVVDGATLLCDNSPIQPHGAPAMSTPLTEQIAALRSKVLSGTITDAELREALKLLREQRVSASASSAKSRAARPGPVDGEEVLALFN